MIIGLSGRARHGKSTATEAIIEQAEALGLSYGVYDIGALVLRHCIERGTLPNKRREDLTREELDTMVKTGKGMREEDPEFWIKKVFEAIEEDRPDVAIIPNIRYLNEAYEFTRNGRGHIIRVVSLNNDGSEYISPDRDSNHPSETELHSYPFDYWIKTKRGDAALVGELAATIFSYLWEIQ